MTFLKNLTLILITLKLCRVIDWWWLWVWFPLWIELTLFLVVSHLEKKEESERATLPD
jgi:hypothetical protein